MTPDAPHPLPPDILVEPPVGSLGLSASAPNAEAPTDPPPTTRPPTLPPG